MVYVVAAALGFVNVFDNPARQAFILDVVGADNLTSAVSLNNVNFKRSPNPRSRPGRVTIDTIGIGPCFLFNAVSYGAVIVALLAMRQRDLYPSPHQMRGRHQLRDGLSYVRRTPELFVPICMMFVVGTMTYETQVTIPLLAKHTFHGDAGTFSAMTVAMGIGAVVGGMLFAVHLTATRGNLPAGHRTPRSGHGAVRRRPTLPEELGVLTVLGASSVHFWPWPTPHCSSPPPRPCGSGDVAVVDGLHRLQSDRGANHRRRRPALRSAWAVALGGSAPLVAAALAWPSLRRLPGGLHTVPRAHVVVV